MGLTGLDLVAKKLATEVSSCFLQCFARNSELGKEVKIMKNEDNLVKEQLLLDWPKIQCKDCGEYFKKDEVYTVSGGKVCEDCNQSYQE